VRKKHFFSKNAARQLADLVFSHLSPSSFAPPPFGDFALIGDGFLWNKKSHSPVDEWQTI